MPALTRQEIAVIFKKARRVIKHPGLDILVMATTHPGRILVVTSRRVGNAPARNKVRRRLKAIFYEEKLATYGYDCIVIIKPGGTELTFETLRDLLMQALKMQTASKRGNA